MFCTECNNEITLVLKLQRDLLDMVKVKLGYSPDSEHFAFCYRCILGALEDKYRVFELEEKTPEEDDITVTIPVR